MDLIRIMGVCVICLPAVLLVKKAAPEQALLLTASAVLAAGLGCVSLTVPAVEKLRELFARAGLEDAYTAVLMKTLAAAVVTRLCADLCRDGGSQSLAGAVELAGAGASFLMAMPLLEAVTDLLLGYFT